MVVSKKMTYVVFLRGPIPFHVASVHCPTLVWLVGNLLDQGIKGLKMSGVWWFPSLLHAITLLLRCLVTVNNIWGDNGAHVSWVMTC